MDERHIPAALNELRVVTDAPQIINPSPFPPFTPPDEFTGKNLRHIASCARLNGVPQGSTPSIWIRIRCGDSISGERPCRAHPAKTPTIPAPAKDEGRGLKLESIGPRLPPSSKTRALLAASCLHLRATVRCRFEVRFHFIQSFHWINPPRLCGRHPVCLRKASRLTRSGWPAIALN